MRINLGDLVNMPLPTQWTPEVQVGLPSATVPGSFPESQAYTSQPVPPPGAPTSPTGLALTINPDGSMGLIPETSAAPGSPVLVQHPDGSHYITRFDPNDPHRGLPVRVFRRSDGTHVVVGPTHPQSAQEAHYPGPTPAGYGQNPGAPLLPAGFGSPNGYPQARNYTGVALPSPPGQTSPGFLNRTPLAPQNAPGWVNGWTPQPILPDSMLPAPLRRDNPLLRRVYFQKNRWDMAILEEVRLWAWIASHGGLKSCCRIPELGAPIWDQPPWEVMPSQGIEYREMFSVATDTVPTDGTNTLIGEWRVPIGYDGVLNQFVCGFTGTGFSDFSGDIVWRVQVGARYAKNLGNVVNTFGSFQNAFLVPGYSIRLVSGQTVKLLVSLPNGNAQGGQITAGVFGWTYPRR